MQGKSFYENVLFKIAYGLETGLVKADQWGLDGFWSRKTVSAPQSWMMSTTIFNIMAIQLVPIIIVLSRE